MHTLHTTRAFVVGSYPNGESNMTYKLFTEQIGIVYARGQSVRELKNRNRYALQTGRRPTVTLVKGREVWRVTTAMHDEGWTEEVYLRNEFRRILFLVGKLMPVETVEPKVFRELEQCVEVLRTCPKIDAEYVEAVVVLRIVDILGYVGRPLSSPEVLQFLEPEHLTCTMVKDAILHKRRLVQKVNSALECAR